MQENFSYYSYSRLRDDGSLEKERRLLVEEQKLCKARAHKFSLETNRRRKALDERRKQWDVQEQRLRERILQQRRLQVQEATERFQRAHLPPSQRRRQSFKRNVTNIEDALRQIQDTLSSYTQQSSSLSGSTNVSRSCTPSPKPPTVSKSSHRQALSAVEAYTKLLQEQSRAEKQLDDSPQREDALTWKPYFQGSYLCDSCVSESLSSKDSLENEDPNHSTKTSQCSYSSFLLGMESAHQDLRKQDHLYPQTSDVTSVSAMMLLGNNLAQANKWHEANQKKLEESDRSNNNNMRASKASWGFTSVEQKLRTEIQSALHNCNVSARSGNPEPFEVKTPQNNSGNIIIANIAALSNGALDSSCPKQKGLLDPTQERIHDDRQLKYPTTEVPLPAKNSISKDVLFGDPSKRNIFLTTDNLSKGALQQTGKESGSLSSQKELSASINNLNKVSNLESNTRKPINTESMEHACSSNIQSATHKCRECPEKEVEKIPVSIEASHAVCEVRFIKGILKKQSKYNDTSCVYSSGRLIFAKQVALAIRDSVELARRKTKDLGGNSAVKKKLRWFDEVHVDKEEEKPMKGKSSDLRHPKNSSDDHQLSLSALSRTPKNGATMTLAASAGYHFTKEAWADVHVNLPQQQADEVKTQRSSTRASGPKVPRRERSGRAGPVSHRTRKGTVIRPQSATEVSQIAKTQGKLVVPRPPPRVESVEEKTPCVTKTPYGRDHASGINKQAVAVEQVLHRSSSAKTHNVITPESTVLGTPLMPSRTCPFSEGDTVSMPSSGHREPHPCRRRRGTAHNEKDLCLDCTPTEEEISQLWHGVRSALATKDAKTIIKGPAVESGQDLRKACVEQSRQAPGSGNRRLLQTSQQTKLLRPFSSTHSSAFPDEDFESAAEVHAKGRVGERDTVAAMETVQTQRPGAAQQCSQQQGLTTISLEEQNILLCLDRLNHQLRCVQEHVGGNTGMHGLVLSDATYAREGKASNHNRHHAASVSNHSRYQKP